MVNFQALVRLCTDCINLIGKRMKNIVATKVYFFTKQLVNLMVLWLGLNFAMIFRLKTHN